MSERNPFEQTPTGPSKGRELQCEEWEALLADALDGTLPLRDAVPFEDHSASCPACGQLLTEAKQGQQWLRFLHEEPEAPADLVAKILDRTSGAAVGELAVAGGMQPIPTRVVPFWQRVAPPPALRRVFGDSRLMMTAAMAFFSIALTLNLAGVRITAVRVSDLKPSSLRNNLTRQFFSANARVHQYYDSLRVVYEFESKVRELRRDVQPDEPASPKTQPAEPSAQQSSPQGSARKNGGKSEAPRTTQPHPVLWGQPLEAKLQIANGSLSGVTLLNEVSVVTGHEVRPLVNKRQDQAERSLA
jgi:hypothetical protein